MGPCTSNGECNSQCCHHLHNQCIVTQHPELCKREDDENLLYALIALAGVLLVGGILGLVFSSVYRKKKGSQAIPSSSFRRGSFSQSPP